MSDIVVISLERWDGVWRRNQHLIHGLLEKDPGLRVLFVEPAADPLHAARRRSLPRSGAGVSGIKPQDGESWLGRLWSLQPTKWLPRFVHHGADERLARSVLRAAKRLGMTDPILWVNDPFGAVILRLTGWRSLYDITDDWLLADRSPQERQRLVRQENYLLDRCREVVVCSPKLEEDKGSSRRVQLVPNAVELKAYQKLGPRPRDLPDGPVVLYVGTLHRDRLDVSLCVDLARHLVGQASLVFVGPVALEGADRRLLSEAGALLLGPRDVALVPHYLQHADVLAVPHVVTPFTESLDPIKAYEYRAAGRPVVSTPVPGFRETTSDVVRIVESGEQFVGTVGSLIAAGRTPTVRQSGTPDWSHRVEDFTRILRRIDEPHSDTDAS